jgi:hypothetical protein
MKIKCRFCGKEVENISKHLWEEHYEIMRMKLSKGIQRRRRRGRRY